MFGWFKSKQKGFSEPVIPQNVENFHNPKSVLEKFTAITGIHFNEKESITTSKLIHFCRNAQIMSFEELYLKIVKEKAVLDALINTLTVNETYFFREARQIYFLVEKVAKERKKIRILCAPGSTGEEPYSIAIALLDHGISPLDIEIFSIDINSDVIVSAKEGLYTSRSLHKTTDALREKYFLKSGEGFRIQDQVKRVVTFHTFNIFDDRIFDLGKFDTVFSRNMLIYFDEATVIRAVERLSRFAKNHESIFFFGHADFVKTPPSLIEHYEEGVKFYTVR